MATMIGNTPLAVAREGVCVGSLGEGGPHTPPDGDGTREQTKIKTWETRIMITDHAPDYADGWPSGGERIGPAWRDIWAHLSRVDGWRTTTEITRTPLVARHDLAPGTIAEMLRRGRLAGLLDVRYRPCGTPRVRRALYRIRP